MAPRHPTASMGIGLLKIICTFTLDMVPLTHWSNDVNGQSGLGGRGRWEDVVVESEPCARGAGPPRWRAVHSWLCMVAVVLVPVMVSFACLCEQSSDRGDGGSVDWGRPPRAGRSLEPAALAVM